MRKNLIIMFLYLFLLNIKAQEYQVISNRRYDEVVWLCTHNAFNYQGRFLLPNQRYSIKKQLNDGVRALMLDVYKKKDNIILKHGYSILGKQKFKTQLLIIKEFLDKNPNEIITIIFESYVDNMDWYNIFKQYDLHKYMYYQSIDKPWAKISEMVSMNKRLVIFSDRNENIKTSNFYYVWDYALETSYSIHNINEFVCQMNRGSKENQLFILNNFITKKIGVGSRKGAKKANEFNFLYNRCKQCMRELNKLPNFLTVDFYNIGKSKQVVDSLNVGLMK